ncbi:MAG: cytochrome C biogenesis protein, partial [Bacteroidales bacterium]|nr:cytochrome C biogenesis protein [Bacteroidales bacterium]
MNKILRTLFSMKLAGILLAGISIILAVATFIENDYGALYAKAVVYGAWWFEFILLLLAINLTGAILYFKLYKRNKVSRGIFHLSFVLILAGAFFTKHYAVEGNMMIREGECSNQFVG